MDIITLFCELTTFFLRPNNFKHNTSCLKYPEQAIPRGRLRCLHPSKVMTILVYFHQKRYKNFKAYYQDYVCCQLRWAFPNLVSYSRFVQLSQEVLVPLSIFLNTRFGKS